MSKRRPSLDALAFGLLLAAVIHGCPSKEAQTPGATSPSGSNTTTTQPPGAVLRPSSPASRPSPQPSAPASAPASQPGAMLDRGRSPGTRDQVDEDGVVRRGDALSSTPALSVEECESKASTLENQTVKITGVIGSVCQAKGCWMVLKGGHDGYIRITAKDYGFFVPRNAKGLVATVEGLLHTEMLDVETAQHLEDESGRDTPRKITAPVKEVVITATGLELRRPSAS